MDSYWKRIYYTGGYTLNDLKVNDLWDSAKSGIPDVGNHTYPNPAFIKFKDGGVVYQNSETGELGIAHNSGASIIMEADGNIIINSKDNKIQIKNTLADLKSIIEDIRGVVNDLSTPLNLSSPAGPVIFSLAPQAIATLGLAEQNLNHLMEDA